MQLYYKNKLVNPLLQVNYNDLSNKPSINGVELDSDKTSTEIKITWFGTQSEYDAITVKNPNTLYIIDDGDQTGGSEGDLNYLDLINKPSINNVELTGNTSLDDLDVYSKEEVDSLAGDWDFSINGVDITGGDYKSEDLKVFWYGTQAQYNLLPSGTGSEGDETMYIINGSTTTSKSLVDLIYPVGSIYLSTTLSTVLQVQNALGGTWSRFNAGYYFVTATSGGGNSTTGPDAGSTSSAVKVYAFKRTA